MRQIIVTRDFGEIRTGDIQVTRQAPNQHTKNVMILFSELITVFESGTQKDVILILDPPIVPCDLP